MLLQQTHLKFLTHVFLSNDHETCAALHINPETQSLKTWPISKRASSFSTGAEACVPWATQSSPAIVSCQAALMHSSLESHDLPRPAPSPVPVAYRHTPYCAVSVSIPVCGVPWSASLYLYKLARVMRLVNLRARHGSRALHFY